MSNACRPSLANDAGRPNAAMALSIPKQKEKFHAKQLNQQVPPSWHVQIRRPEPDPLISSQLLFPDSRAPFHLKSKRKCLHSIPPRTP